MQFMRYSRSNSGFLFFFYSYNYYFSNNFYFIFCFVGIKYCSFVVGRYLCGSFNCASGNVVATVTVTCDQGKIPIFSNTNKREPETKISKQLEITNENIQYKQIESKTENTKKTKKSGVAVYSFFNTGDLAVIHCSTTIESVIVENGMNCPGNLSASQTCNRCVTSEDIQICELFVGK